MALILFTGVDKTGKSTLMANVLRTTNRHVCVDRFTPCQYVYGKIHNKKDNISYEDLLKMEHALNDSLNCFFVHTEASLIDIANRFEEHNEDDIEVDQILEVMISYREYLKNTPIKVLRINTSRNTIDECTKMIIDYANKLDGDD